MGKLVAQALIVLHHAQAAEGAINQKTQHHHIILHRYASRGYWSDYFTYAGNANVNVPECSWTFGVFPRKYTLG